MKGTASGHYSMAMAGRNGCGNLRETEARHLSVRMMMMRRYECNLESDQGDKSDVGRVTAESMTYPTRDCMHTAVSGEEVSHLIEQAPEKRLSVCGPQTLRGVRVHSPPSAARTSTFLRIRSRGSQLLRS
jgi:hypothetical protein